MIQPSIFGAPTGGQPIWPPFHVMLIWPQEKKGINDRLGNIRGSGVVFIVAICYNDGPCHKLYLVEVVDNWWSLQWLGCLQLPQVVGATACDPGYSMPMPIYGMFPPMWGMKAAVSWNTVGQDGLCPSRISGHFFSVAPHISRYVSHFGPCYSYLVGGDWNMAFISFMTFHILGMSWPQLTFTPSFFRGVGVPTTNQYIQRTPPCRARAKERANNSRWTMPWRLVLTKPCWRRMDDENIKMTNSFMSFINGT